MKRKFEKIILVAGWGGYEDAVSGLARITKDIHGFLRSPKGVDMVLFTGGEDVDPALYGDTSPNFVCHYNPRRDRVEREVYRQALKYDLPMTGICRGLQFLNVMAGGKMMHHLSNHGGTIHQMVTHDGRLIAINSIHHQMILPAETAIVIGKCVPKLSTTYIGANDEYVEYMGDEIEAAIFPGIKGFGVQYHPEAMNPSAAGYRYFNDMVGFALHNPWKEFVKEYDPTKIHMHDGVLAVRQVASVSE